jgi:hypothetical protein
MSKYIVFFLFIEIIIFSSINCQINVLAPPSVVQKVKELENGSKS